MPKFVTTVIPPTMAMGAVRLVHVKEVVGMQRFSLFLRLVTMVTLMLVGIVMPIALVPEPVLSVVMATIVPKQSFVMMELLTVVVPVTATVALQG